MGGMVVLISTMFGRCVWEQHLEDQLYGSEFQDVEQSKVQDVEENRGEYANRETNCCMAVQRMDNDE